MSHSRFPTAPLRVDIWSMHQADKEPGKNGLDSGPWSKVWTWTMDTDLAPHMAIGAAAKRAGVGIDTIRYSERERPLPPPRRRASGYRDYDIAAVVRLRLIGTGGGLMMRSIRS